MKLKALLLALGLAGLGAAFVLTDTGRSETGTTGTTTTGTTTTSTTTSSDGCSRFELRGTLATVSASSFTVTVAKGSKAAKALVGTTATVAVGADTRVSWSGRGTLTGPNAGDGVEVSGKACGAALTASRVEARGPGKERAHEDSGKSSGAGEKDRHGKKK